MKRAAQFMCAFGAGWVLGWVSWFAVAAYVAYREYAE